MKAFPLVWADEGQDAVRVDDWPNPSRPNKTVMMYTQDFAGTITIQASLHVDPEEGDWFDIHVEDFSRPQSNQHTEQNRFFNSRDRYIWMRAIVVTGYGRVDRVVVI